MAVDNCNAVYLFLEVAMKALKDRRIERLRVRNRNRGLVDSVMLDLIKDCLTIVSTNGLHDFIEAIAQNEDYRNSIEIYVTDQTILDLSLCETIIKEDDWDSRFSDFPGLSEVLKKYTIVKH